MKGLSHDLLNTQNTLVFSKKTFLDSTLTASNELIGIIRQWNTNDVDLIWWFVNESNELRKLINKHLFRKPVLVCWYAKEHNIMRLMSVFNLYEYIWVSPAEIMEYDYWLSERKNATYHVIEYQLSKKFLFLKRCLHYALFLCVILVRWFLYKKASAYFLPLLMPGMCHSCL